jgi:hypothetical protein
MPWIRKTAESVKPYISAIGGWFGVMSGGFSVVFGFFALLNLWSARREFYYLAFAAQWVLIFKLVRENHKQQEARKTRLAFGCGENIGIPI